MKQLTTLCAFILLAFFLSSTALATKDNSFPSDGQDISADSFEKALNQMLPLDEVQIQEFLKRSDKREKAIQPAAPVLRTRTERVTLEPGRAPTLVYTSAHVATSLVFHDSTGQPWPITSVTNGNPESFQVLKPEVADSNLLTVLPGQNYASATIVVTLEGRDVPLVIRLEADSVRGKQRKADALVLFQLAHHGPKANPPIVESSPETASSVLLSFLDQVPPKGAERLRITPDTPSLSVWKFNDRHYIRTSHTLMWPAWNTAVNGAGGIRCYEAPATSRISLSIQGQIETKTLTTSR